MTQAQYKADQISRLNTLLSIAPMADISAVMNKYGETRTAVTAESLYNAMLKHGSGFAADLRTVGYKALESPEMQRLIKAYPAITVTDKSTGDGTKAKNVLDGISGLIEAIGSSAGVIMQNTDTTGTAQTDAQTRLTLANAELANAQSNLENANANGNTKTIIIVAVVLVVLALVITGIVLATRKR